MNRMYGNYQLREAAGSYWLIDMTQNGKIWKKPLQLNETGAVLLQGFFKGRTPEALAGELAKEYELPVETMRADVTEFFSQLSANGIHPVQTNGES